MEIVDFHSHFFSRPFFDALAAQSPLDDPFGTIEKKTPIEIPPDDLDVHLARWTHDLDAKGCDHLVTFASLPEEAPAVAEAVRKSDGRLSGVTLVNPHADPNIEKLLDEDGFKGVLLFPAMHHFHIAEQTELLAPLNERGALVYLHCGLLVVKLRDILGLPRPYDLRWANPLDVIPAANAFPDIKFIIPHFGAGFLRETLMAGAQCENVFVDTSSSNSWTRTQGTGLELVDVFGSALEVFGAQRVLFGTDSNVFPAGWQRDRLDEQRRLFEELGADLPAIFGENARRLLG